MSHASFTVMEEPYVYGFHAERADGIVVEVVECGVGEWDVFLTRGGHVVASSVKAHGAWGSGYGSRAEAWKIARELMI